MATKKQRRRREKERRHEYETVYVDEHGEEVEVEEHPKPAKAEARKAPAGQQRPAPRVIEPPSWNKVFRRTVIFAPIIVVFIYLTAKDRSSYSAYLPALPLLVLLPPVMYLTDSLLYRSYLKRTGKGGGAAPKA